MATQYLNGVTVCCWQQLPTLPDVPLSSDPRRALVIAGSVPKTCPAGCCVGQSTANAACAKFSRSRYCALLGGDGDPEDTAAVELTRRLVVLAHCIAAVASDAQTVAR
jgi:hypothetical protein